MKIYFSVIFSMFFINSIYSQTFTQQELEILSPTLQESRNQQMLLKMNEEAWQRKFESDRKKMLQDLDKINKAKPMQDEVQDFDQEKAYEDLKNAISSPTPSISASAVPQGLPATTVNGTDLSRFAKSPCFKTLGYVPGDPGIEERYRICEEIKRNDQLAKFGLAALIVTGIIVAAWYSFKAFTSTK